MYLLNSLNKTLKKMENGKKIMEKSGKIINPKMWEPCLIILGIQIVKQPQDTTFPESSQKIHFNFIANRNDRIFFSCTCRPVILPVWLSCTVTHWRVHHHPVRSANPWFPD